MIPKVSRGGVEFGRLMKYLVGPGRHNEHRNPHVVATDGVAGFNEWLEGVQLTGADARQLAMQLEAPAEANGYRVHPQGNVFHCSLSLSAREEPLSDERWGQVVTRFMQEMGFDDQAGQKAPMRWLAVRHGLSRGGNDHVHVVAQMIREDGTPAKDFRTFVKAQRVCRVLEREFGLEELESVQVGRATRGWEFGEKEAVQRQRAQAEHEQQYGEGSWSQLSRVERDRLVADQELGYQPRELLGVRLRAGLVMSSSEAEFVARLRESGVWVRAREDGEHPGTASGYSVALAPRFVGEKPVWFGAYRVGRDLSLARVRQQLEDSPEARREAWKVWREPGRYRVGLQQVDDAQLREYIDEVSGLVDSLWLTPPSQASRWASVAGQLSGVFGAWSVQQEKGFGPLARTAHTLGKAAQTYAPQQKFSSWAGQGFRCSARLATALGKNVRAGQQVMMQEMLRAMQAIAAAQEAQQQYLLSRELRERIEAQRAQVQINYEQLRGLDRGLQPVAPEAPVVSVSPGSDAALDSSPSSRSGSGWVLRSSTSTASSAPVAAPVSAGVAGGSRADALRAAGVSEAAIRAMQIAGLAEPSNPVAVPAAGSVKPNMGQGFRSQQQSQKENEHGIG